MLAVEVAPLGFYVRTNYSSFSSFLDDFSLENWFGFVSVQLLLYFFHFVQFKVLQCVPEAEVSISPQKMKWCITEYIGFLNIRPGVGNFWIGHCAPKVFNGLA